ncbi:MAG: hypothetical protein CME16_04425 [Gemmatimonadetes bacterium]|nr:hypothetical protein [Gemmatimonadota bacterium]
MPAIEILGTGWVDQRDSAFPQAVQLPNGDLLCCFSVGGGPNVNGGTDWARSIDGGETWQLEGNLVAPTTEPPSTYALKLSLAADGQVVFAYGSHSFRRAEESFGDGTNEAVFCRSIDGGRTWSKPTQVPMAGHSLLEISHGILPLDSGRLLAPAATLPAKGRLGEQVLVAISDDGGLTWPRHGVVFEDPDKRFGYFEQKLAQISPDLLIATCWTVTLNEVSDQPDSFVLSHDRGSTWGRPQSTGIMGQTMTPIPLGEDRLLILYNRRYGEQGIVMNLVTFTETEWTIHYEGLLYDSGSQRHRPQDVETGVEEFDSFMFGFPTALRLQDGTFLATHWCKENGPFGIRWTRLRVDW